MLKYSLMSVNSHHFYCTPTATKWTPIIRDKQVPLSQSLSTCLQVWSFKTGINTYLVTFEVLVCFTHTPALWNCYALWNQTRGSFSEPDLRLSDCHKQKNHNSHWHGKASRSSSSDVDTEGEVFFHWVVVLACRHWSMTGKVPVDSGACQSGVIAVLLRKAPFFTQPHRATFYTFHEPSQPLPSLPLSRTHAVMWSLFLIQRPSCHSPITFLSSLNLSFPPLSNPVCPLLFWTASLLVLSVHLHR